MELIIEQIKTEDYSLAATTCWAIWSDRNKLVQNHQLPGLDFKTASIIAYTSSFKEARDAPRPSLQPP